MHLALFSFVIATLSVQQAVSLLDDKCAASINDTDILRFALSLELLEPAFYKQALHLFNESDLKAAGFTPLVFSRFVEIAQHENEHVEFLTTALGDKASQAYKYSFPIPNIQPFTLMSQVLEDIGSSAYNSAISFLSWSANTLASASIFTTGVHQTTCVSTDVNKNVPLSLAFRTPLTMRRAFTATSGSRFITSCPTTNPNLGIYASALNITNAFRPFLGQSVFPGENAPVQCAPSSNITATHILFGLLPIFVLIQRRIRRCSWKSVWTGICDGHIECD